MDINSDKWESLSDLLKDQLNELTEIQNTLYSYYRSQISLEEILNFIKSRKISDPENKYIFIDFFNIMVDCDLNNQLLTALKDDIFKVFTKNDLFSIFAQRKKILHVLFNLGFISPHTIQQNINNSIFKDFYNDIKSKLPESYLSKYISKNELENFIQQFQKEEEGKKGILSEKKLKDIIKDDDIDSFIDFINRANLELNGKLPTTQFEVEFKFKNSPPTLIEYAAKNGSVKIFKYLLINKVDIKSNIKEDAIFGGNIEIIHLIEEQNFNFDSKCLSVAIERRNNVIYDYLRNSVGLDLGIEQIKSSIRAFNLYTLNDCISERSDLFLNRNSFKEIFITCCSCGFFLMFNFLYTKLMPLFENPKFDMNFFYFNDETVLHIAVKNYKTEIVKILLSNSEINTNSTDINGIFTSFLDF